MKKLEEMSLIDDFLMNSLTSHPVYGREAMKYILGCIFQRSIGELLRYLGDSRWENATSKELQKLHHMVTEVKHDGKVGLAYMKSFERDKRLLERGREEGEALGRAEGEALGRAQGEALGRAEGEALGRNEKTRIIVTNMLRRGMSDEDIRALAECEQELIDEVRKA